MSTQQNQPTVKPGDHSKVSMRVKSLESVKQLSASFESESGDVAPPYRAEMDVPEYKVLRPDDSTLQVEGTFRFEGHRDGDLPAEGDAKDRSPFIWINAKFEVVYELEPGGVFTEDDVNAFAAINTTLNLFPFWREYVHDVLSRAGFATFLLPPFNPIKSGMLRPRPAAPAGDAPPKAN